MARLHIFADPDKLAQGCASFIADVTTAAVAEHGSANLAISGGGTPTATYEQLAQSPIDWRVIHIFWVAVCRQTTLKVISV
jgi:6-phosphogluconolactonase